MNRKTQPKSGTANPKEFLFGSTGSHAFTIVLWKPTLQDTIFGTKKELCFKAGSVSKLGTPRIQHPAVDELIASQLKHAEYPRAGAATLALRSGIQQWVWVA
jgi:hypothetical protein